MENIWQAAVCRALAGAGKGAYKPACTMRFPAAAQYTIAAIAALLAGVAGSSLWTEANLVAERSAPFLPGTLVADDADTSFTTEGEKWMQIGGGFRSGSRTHMRRLEVVERLVSATWSFPSVAPGTYSLHVTWIRGMTHAKNVSYLLRGTSTLPDPTNPILLTARVNQSKNPEGRRWGEGRRTWEELGTLVVEKEGHLFLTAQGKASERFDADAAILVPVSTLAPAA